LKFYPLVLLIWLLPERRRTVLTVGTVVIAVIAGFGILFHDELPRMLVNLPTSFPPGQGWGAKGLPAGLNDLFPAMTAAFGYHAAWIDSLPETHILAYGIVIVLLAVSLSSGLRLAHRADLVDALQRLPPRDSRFLVTGAALICGCFFSGQSLPYRGVYLLFALPALLSISHDSVTPATRAIVRWTMAAIVLVLWQVPLRRAIASWSGGTYFPVNGGVANYAAWMVVEAVWWWTVTFMLSILLWFLASVQMGNVRYLPSPHRTDMPDRELLSA
jgi:hypothetical protein